jgi:hypothetical protein
MHDALACPLHEQRTRRTGLHRQSIRFSGLSDTQQ